MIRAPSLLADMSIPILKEYGVEKPFAFALKPHPKTLEIIATAKGLRANTSIFVCIILKLVEKPTCAKISEIRKGMKDYLW